jgi:hypothetical protein
MESLHEASTSGNEERAFQARASNIIEALFNLTFLICEEAGSPGKVRYYADLSEERLRAMANLLRERAN